MVRLSSGLTRNYCRASKDLPRREKGLLLDVLCPAFADVGQNVLVGCGKENLEKLHEVANRFGTPKVSSRCCQMVVSSSAMSKEADCTVKHIIHCR